MNIAKKSLEALIDTEIARLRQEVEAEVARGAGYAIQIINERDRALRAAIAAAPKLDALIADAEFLAVVDKEIASSFDSGVELHLYAQGERVRMHDQQNHFALNHSRRKYRFVVAAIALDDEEPK